MTDRCLDEDELAAWVDGALSDADRQRALAHIATCASCREQVSELAKVASMPFRGADDGPGPVEVGAKIGRFEVLQVIGRGGMGVVVRARDDRLDREVAIKLVHPGAAPNARLGERLTSEARALAALHHPNLVTVFEVGDHGEAPFVVMELVEGMTLRAFATSAGHTSEEVLAACVAAGHGLAALHRGGFVHRDVKPENVIVATSGRVVLVDLGLAQRVVDEEAVVAKRAPPLTRTGALVGTPRYLAPERFVGKPADVRADVYAFSAMALEVLRATGGAVPKRVRDALARGQDPDAVHRFASMDALLDALAPPSRALRALAALALGGAVIAGIVGIVAAARQPDATATANVDADANADVGESALPARPAPSPVSNPTSAASVPLTLLEAPPIGSASMISGKPFPGATAPKLTLEDLRSLRKPTTSDEAQRSLIAAGRSCARIDPQEPKAPRINPVTMDYDDPIGVARDKHPRGSFPFDIEWGTVEKSGIASFTNDDGEVRDGWFVQVKGQRDRYVFNAFGKNFLDVKDGEQVLFCTAGRAKGTKPAGFSGTYIRSFTYGGPIAGTPAFWKRAPRFINQPYVVGVDKWPFSDDEVFFRVDRPREDDPREEALPPGWRNMGIYYLDVSKAAHAKLLDAATHKAPAWVFGKFGSFHERRGTRYPVLRVTDVLNTLFEAPVAGAARP